MWMGSLWHSGNLVNIWKWMSQMSWDLPEQSHHAIPGYCCPVALYREFFVPNTFCPATLVEHSRCSTSPFCQESLTASHLFPHLPFWPDKCNASMSFALAAGGAGQGAARQGAGGRGRSQTAAAAQGCHAGQQHLRPSSNTPPPALPPHPGDIMVPVVLWPRKLSKAASMQWCTVQKETAVCCNGNA